MTQLFSAIAPATSFEDDLIRRLRLRGSILRIPPMVHRAAVAAAIALTLGGFGYLATKRFDLNQIQSAANVQIENKSVNFRTLYDARRGPGYGDQEPSAQPAGVSGGFKLNDSVRGEFGLAGDSNGGNDQGVARERFRQIATDRSSTPGFIFNGTLSPDKDADGITHSFPELQKAAEGRLTVNVQDKLGVATGGALVVGKGTVVLGNAAPAGGPVSANRVYYHSAQKQSDYFKPTAGPVAAPSQIVTGKPITTTEDVALLPGVPQPRASEPNQPVAKNLLAEVDEEKSKSDTKPPAQESSEPQRPPTTQESVRKVIRNGDIEFEVDSFDSASGTITKIALEEGGYIATTNSEKLPNGKVKGVIVVRIPPDHLDTLVLKLRALGDLKSQNLTAQDVTKQYTDTASELRAARAMEDRLLNIIKTSQGAIKDLLAAEKELAVWREKIEKLEGTIRYYDNLASLSTLNISLFERDIKKADVLKETENVDMGVETDDVEASRASAIKAIDDAKGRIVESELKKLDAGQLAARVVADIPPDASGPAIDRLKQLGKVARLEVHRTQKSANDQPAAPGTKLERGETRLVLSLYNLANVAPRQTNNLNLAAADVEQAYNAIIERVDKSGGRVVTSNLNRQSVEQTTGTIAFEVKSADAETVLADIRKTGEVTRLTVAENPDTNNVTAAKRGFNVQIIPLASLQPREVNNRSIASTDVDKSYQAIIESLRKASARIIVSRIEDAGKGEHNGYIDFEIPRSQTDEVEKALSSAGETYNRSVNAAAAADNVTDSKVQYKLGVSPASALPARQNDALAVEVNDVDSAAEKFQSFAISGGGRVVDSSFSKDQHGQSARIIVEVPFTTAAQTVSQARQLGTVRGSQQSTNQQAPSGEFARARIELTLASGDVLVAPEHGVLATLRNGLSTSFAGLMWSLQLIVIGLCLVGPWVALIWVGVKAMKRWRRRQEPVSA